MFNLNNIIKSKTGVVLGALLMCFSISVFVMAWTDPTCDPSVDPSLCNAPAPINSITPDQTITGNLNITSTGADALTIHDGGDLKIISPDGNNSVLLYVDNGEGLTIDGDLDATGSIKRNGNVVWDAGNDGDGSGLDADTLDGYEAADLMGAGGDCSYCCPAAIDVLINPDETWNWIDGIPAKKCDCSGCPTCDSCTDFDEDGIVDWNDWDDTNANKKHVNLTAENIKADVDIFGMTGILVGTDVTPASGASEPLTLTTSEAKCGKKFFGVGADSWISQTGTHCDLCYSPTHLTLCTTGACRGQGTECPSGICINGYGCTIDGISDCVCDGTGYEIHTVGTDTVYVDCSVDKCWTTMATSQYSWGPSQDEENNSCVNKGTDYPACDYCDTLDYGGFTDWVLPSATTLKNLCNQQGFVPFGESISAHGYWSASEIDNIHAFLLSDSSPCKLGVLQKNISTNVRCVR